MIKKCSICIFVLLVATILNAKQYSICKSEYQIQENESLKKQLSLEKILDKDPNNIECMLKLSVVYFQTDEVSKAFDLIKKAYRLNPKFVENQKQIVKILDLALKLSRLKEYALKNKDTKTWNRLGKKYYDMRIFKEAIYAYKNSLKIDAKQSKIGVMLALSYGNNNNMLKAIKQLRVILNQEPENFYANYYFAKILKNEMKKPKEAEPYFMYAKYLIDQKITKFDTIRELQFLKSDIRRELEEIKKYFFR